MQEDELLTAAKKLHGTGLAPALNALLAATPELPSAEWRVLLTSIIEQVSLSGNVLPYVAPLTNIIRESNEADGEFLSLAMTIASVPVNREPFAACELAAARPLVEAIAEALGELGEKHCGQWSEIGTAIDIWSQASGIAVANPTECWHMQMDALQRGWRKPRLGRAYWTTTEFPSTQEYAEAVVGKVPDAEKALCLAALVGQGMNRDLALEIARYLGGNSKPQLLDDLQASEAPEEYPPLVQQALSLSRSVVKLTHNLVTGKNLTISHADRERRLQTCSQCEAYVAKSQRCRRCGCYLKAKLPLVTEHCPIGRW